MQLQYMTKRFGRDQRGSILLMAAGGIAMLTVLVGFAVDIARYVNLNSKFKNAADAALLAAISVSLDEDRDLNDVATRFFEANFPTSNRGDLTVNQIKIEKDSANLEWTATVDAEIKLLFGQLVGVDTMRVSHKVKVAWDIRQRIEAVFTLDTSASMCMQVGRSPRGDDKGVNILSFEPYPGAETDPSKCLKLQKMKTAMNYVLDKGIAAVNLKGGGALFNVGIVPYNHKINFTAAKGIPKPLADYAPPGYFNNLEDAKPLSPMIPLMAVNSADDKKKLDNLVNNITQNSTGLGWTRSNIAVWTAALMLDPAYASSFGGETPAALQTANTDKIVVMMTDGSNVSCCYAAYPEGDFTNQYLYMYEPDNAHLVGIDKVPSMSKWQSAYNIPTKGLCQQMKDQGIKIYSVVLDVQDNDPGGKEIKDVYKECASSEQFYFDVRDTDELELAYKTIANSLLRLRISY